MRSRGRTQGFTLIELIIAVAVMAVIAPAIGRALIQSVRSWREARTDAERRQAARGALAVLERDVRRYLNAPGVGFKGETDRVEFVVVAPVVQSSRLIGFKARRVRYESSTDGWARTEFPARPDDDVKPVRAPLPGRVTFDYGVLARRDAPTVKWSRVWNADTPPSMIRAVLRAEGARGEMEFTKTVSVQGGDGA